MKAMYLGSVIFLLSLQLFAQSIDVKYDKKKDLTRYKTFAFRDSQIISATSQKLVNDTTLNGWIIRGITNEFNKKGLIHSDSLPDLIVTYLVSTSNRTAYQKGGPQLLPGAGGAIKGYSYGFPERNFNIDMNDRNGTLLWNVYYSNINNLVETEEIVNYIIKKGFSKFRKNYKSKR